MSLTNVNALTAKLENTQSIPLDPQNGLSLCPSLLGLKQEELVDIALTRLQSAGVQLVEWGGLLFRRMHVPIIIRVRRVVYIHLPVR